MRMILYLLLFLNFPAYSYLAPKRQKDFTYNVLSLLKSNMPHKKKVLILKKNSKKALPSLKSLYLNDSISFGNRWVALMLYARVGQGKNLKDLISALENRQWFIRSASAKALGYMKAKKAVPYLIRALNDRSLVVRTSAVDALASIKDERAIKPLIKVLYDDKNFYRGKGLWVRRHAVDAVTEIKGPDAINFLLGCLEDQDRFVVKSAVTSLEKLTGISYKGISLASRIDKWKYFKSTGGKKQSGNISVEFVR